MIIYNRALTEAEEARIGNYLAQKYALTVNFPGVAPDYTTNGSTWSNGYLGVFHLRETSGQHFSSTAGNAATRSVSATNQGTSTGIVGTADNFNGTSNYVNLPDFGSSPQVTVEAWVNLTAAPGSAGGGIVSSDTWAAGYTHFKATSNRSINAAINSSGTVSSPAAALPLGTWSHVAYTVSGNTSNGLALYQDGSLLGSATGQTSNNLTGLNIGREYSTRYLNAKFDEVRVSSVARSAAWLQATHATISAPATFANASFVSTYAANAPAMVATRPANSITGSTATLNGNLASTGGAATTVTLYWGSSDGGTTPGNWANSIALGTLPVGNFSANLSSLTPGATYHFRAFASNTNGDSWAPDSLTFTTPTAAPTGLAFSSANGSITLQWNAVSGASSYTVKRATTTGGPYTTLLSNITGTTFLDPAATPGGTWHYVVSASNASGESANSAELSIPTLNAPANLTATPGNATVALAWTASAGATSYTVKRATTSGGPYTVQGSTAATTFNDPATNGTTYFYIVTATAAGFESPPSNEKSATPLASLAAPTGLAAVPATTSAILTWNTVANAQSYTLKRSTTSGSGYTNVATGLLSPSFTNTGLTNGTPYYYIVVAINGSITSANSAEATVIPAATPTTFTTASAGTWSTAIWTPTNPIAAFATTIVLNNSGSITSTQNLGSFLFNKLQLTGQAVALSGDRLYLSGTAPAITGTNNVAHSIANPLTLDSTTTVTAPSNTLTLTGNLDGTGALLKNGAGTLSLSGLSSYNGDTTLDGGTLRYTTDNPDLKTLILGATAGSTTFSTIDLTSASANHHRPRPPKQQHHRQYPHHRRGRNPHHHRQRARRHLQFVHHQQHPPHRHRRGHPPCERRIRPIQRRFQQRRLRRHHHRQPRRTAKLQPAIPQRRRRPDPGQRFIRQYQTRHPHPRHQQPDRARLHPDRQQPGQQRHPNPQARLRHQHPARRFDFHRHHHLTLRRRPRHRRVRLQHHHRHPHPPRSLRHRRRQPLHRRQRRQRQRLRHLRCHRPLRRHQTRLPPHGRVLQRHRPHRHLRLQPRHPRHRQPRCRPRPEHHLHPHQPDQPRRRQRHPRQWRQRKPRPHQPC